MERLTFDPLITPIDARSGGGNTIVASEPHVPARAATHGGTRMNRISSGENEDRDRNRCNSPAGNTKIFWKWLLGADPRKPRGRSNRHRPAGEPAPDTGGSGSDGRPCCGPWPDTAVGHARLANAGPPAGRRHCSTALADASVGTASRSPSTGTADAADDTGRGLEPSHIPGHAVASPRELRTPKRSSRGAEPFIPLRDAFYPLAKPLAPPPLLRNHSNRHRLIAPWLPWSRESGSLLRRRRQDERQEARATAQR
jgi:hypothetical protein